MRLRADPVSKTDRVASTAAASGVTIATALVILTSISARAVLTPTPASPHETERTHRIAYVSPVAKPAVVRSTSEVRSRAHSPRPGVTAPVPERSTAPQQASVASDSSAGVPPPPNATRSAVSDFERRWTGHGVSPLLLPSTPSAPPYAGGANAGGTTVWIPHSGMDRDAQLRAQDMADRAARAAGAPMSPSAHGGISIDAPIPFGGPSNAQRKRDSTINAQTKAVLVRVRQRLDSIAAARQRKRADSLAALEKHP